MLNCPISKQKVDENTTRIIAFFNLGVTVTGIVLHSSMLLLFLAADFSLRAFTDGKYSIIKFAAKTITRILKILPKSTDAAPKKFAAGLGMAFSLIIAFSLYYSFFTAAITVAAILAFCAILEGVFAICVGCHVYNYLSIFRLKQKVNI